jgi:hypothetical protein
MMMVPAIKTAGATCGWRTLECLGRCWRRIGNSVSYSSSYQYSPKSPTAAVVVMQILYSLGDSFTKPDVFGRLLLTKWHHFYKWQCSADASSNGEV